MSRSVSQINQECLKTTNTSANNTKTRKCHIPVLLPCTTTYSKELIEKSLRPLEILQFQDTVRFSQESVSEKGNIAIE